MQLQMCHLQFQTDILFLFADEVQNSDGNLHPAAVYPINEQPTSQEGNSKKVSKNTERHDMSLSRRQEILLHMCFMTTRDTTSESKLGVTSQWKLSHIIF